MKSPLPLRFLHNHPGLEQAMGLDFNHVIVDRKDYEEIMSRIQNKEFESSSNSIETSKKIVIPERRVTDLTFEEELKAPLIFKGEYLKPIDKSWYKFKKNI